MRATVLSIATLFAVGGLSGCGGSDRPVTHPVSGRITMDSKPVADANVGFHPVKVGTPPAVGTTDADGNYQLTTFNTNDGAIASQYTVTVSKKTGGGMADEEVDLADDPGEEYDKMMEEDAVETGEETLPAQYASQETSPEKRTVMEGENTFDIELKK